MMAFDTGHFVVMYMSYVKGTEWDHSASQYDDDASV